MNPLPNVKTTAAKCYVWVKNNPILAVLDSVVIANGDRQRALGKVTNAKLMIRSIIVPTSFQIIDSPDKILLLGINRFQKTRDNKLEIPQEHKTYSSDGEDFFDIYKSENDVKEVEEIQHEINTGDVRLIRQPAYHITPDEQEFLDKKIEKLLENGLIYEDKKNLNKYFEQERCHRELIQQLNDKFYRETTWAYRNRYFSKPEADEGIGLSNKDEVWNPKEMFYSAIIDSENPEWSLPLDDDTNMDWE
ncbi:4279_t:CDS:2 [Cetraspora pellucida]|uniref:4279_t:CDS:1 n=1 Tax=Cetraspora pellucida TaxID=1433469 RepID=A0A9N9HVV4_9GLOM|nr:4279_t:CDS:2 [Cetraspora pellucida]